MIRLHKAEEPESLKEGAADWTAEFLDAIADGTDPSAVWSNRINAQIKLALIAETSGKCAYCESKILHDQYGDIEHFFPKSLDPFRAFEWGNLTFACKICNTRKAARDPHAANIIDPYDVNPENYLIFLGPLVTDNGSDLGRETQAKLGLNRPELCERRREVLERLLLILSNALNATLSVEARRAIYDDFLENEVVDSVQFAAMARAALNVMRHQIEMQWAE